MKLKLNTIFPIAVSVITTAIILALSLIYNAHEKSFWISEGGVIELLSAIGYFLCALLIIAVGKWPYVKKYNYFLILIILFGLRELDFDKKFTTMGLLKSKFYISSSVPLIEKLVGLLVVAIFLYAVMSVIKNHLKEFVLRIKQLSPVYIGVLITFLLLVFTKSIDGIGRKLGDFGITLAEDSSKIFLVLEEILELGIPFVIISTYIVYFSEKKHEN